MSTSDNALGTFLQELMHRQGRLPSQMASDLGLSHTSVSRWLSGDDMPSIASCHKLASYAKVPLEQVIRLARRLPPPPADAPSEMYKIKILVVDDHGMLRDGVRALLGLYDDIEVVGEACEGKEAIEKARELAPDVVLMDIVMPGMDGLEATRRIRKKNPTVKVLVVTQYNSKEYILSAIKAGAVGYISKRALSSELVSAIRTVHRGDPFLYPCATAALIQDYLQQVEEEPYDRLTAREREILKLIAEGHTSREIADMLVISLKTVLGHRTKIMEKLDLHNRAELIKYAIRKGLIIVGDKVG